MKLFLFYVSSTIHFQSGTILQNVLTLDKESIVRYTRMDAFQSRNQYVKAIRDFTIKTSQGESMPDRVNVFSAKYLPAMHQLLKWSTELAHLNRIAAGLHYVECDIGNITYQDIQHMLSLHKVRDVKFAVEQEMNWCNSAKLVPKSVTTYPPDTTTNKFKALLWNTPSAYDLTGQNMTPNALAELCCKR